MVIDTLKLSKCQKVQAQENHQWLGTVFVCDYHCQNKTADLLCTCYIQIAFSVTAGNSDVNNVSLEVVIIIIVIVATTMHF